MPTTGCTAYAALWRKQPKSIARLIAGASGEPRIVEAYSLAGYTYIAFGENYCSGVPFSKAPTAGETEFGMPMAGAEIFEIAIDRFDLALANVSGNTEMEYLARVGKARALLNLGRYDAAAAEVASVPTGFAYVTEHSDNSLRERNAVYWINVQQHRWSVADNEGGNGLPFRSANDPRVPWVESVPRRSGGPQYDLLKYPDASASLVLADGIEARLIEAEALLQSGDATARYPSKSGTSQLHGMPGSRGVTGPLPVLGEGMRLTRLGA